MKDKQIYISSDALRHIIIDARPCILMQPRVMGCFGSLNLRHPHSGDSAGTDQSPTCPSRHSQNMVYSPDLQISTWLFSCLWDVFNGLSLCGVSHAEQGVCLSEGVHCALSTPFLSRHAPSSPALTEVHENQFCVFCFLLLPWDSWL